MSLKNITDQAFGEYTLSVSEGDPCQLDYFLASNFKTENPSSLKEFTWKKGTKVLACLPVTVQEGGVLTSLDKSPFGGIWTQTTLKSRDLQEFILAVMEYAQKMGFRELRLIQAPKPYESHSDLINYLLFKSGFELQSILSHQFFLGKKKIKKMVDQRFAKTMAKLKQEQAEIQSGFIAQFSFLNDIKKWNLNRGYNFEVDEDGLIRQVSLFPARYFLISILKNQKPIAHSLAVKLTSNSFYYFLSAIDPESGLKNGGEYMLMKLFQLAVAEKSEFIDLGTSDQLGGANHPLMFFKSRFSNDISNKVNWIKFL
ncbi:hypothetical protein [Algoriphagus sp.]|uniref:hypothetical protein n=1 Tax=Algoriphagus sp. TaxID=1872435 RepID=UPI0026236ADC|nr:hypothetical protein [Algoriphagus sp.]